MENTVFKQETPGSCKSSLVFNLNTKDRGGGIKSDPTVFCLFQTPLRGPAVVSRRVCLSLCAMWRHLKQSRPRCRVFLGIKAKSQVSPAESALARPTPLETAVYLPPVPKGEKQISLYLAALSVERGEKAGVEAGCKGLPRERRFGLSTF